MKQYVGCKVINAKPMNRQDYNDFRGWELPANEDGADEGSLVEYTNDSNPNTTEYKGYVSWSPKSVFEDSYLEATNLPFSLALEALKRGCRITRKGWNGIGTLVELQLFDGHSKEGSPCIFMDTIGLQTDSPDASKSRVPWIASQTDMLAVDWEVLND